MAAYAIFSIGIVSATYEQYRSQGGATIEKYGGKFIVHGGAAEKVEGDYPKRIVIIEFESIERVRQWEYTGGSPTTMSPIFALSSVPQFVIKLLFRCLPQLITG